MAVPVRVGSRLVAAMREPTYPFRQIALDYEHNTWPGSKAYQETREPREVTAFLTVEAVEGQGVFVNVDRWTPSGLRHAGNFCDLSVTPLLDQAQTAGLAAKSRCKFGQELPDALHDPQSDQRQSIGG